MPLDDSFKKGLTKTLWLWLPFYAFQRLLREYLKQKK